MHRAQFVKALSNSQELTNLSSKLPGEEEKDYLHFTDVEAKDRCIKWLTSGHLQGTSGCRSTFWFGSGAKKKWFYEILHFFSPNGENTFFGLLPTGELQGPQSLPQGLSVMLLMSATKNTRKWPWPDALDVKEYILAEWGELGNPPKGFDY